MTRLAFTYLPNMASTKSGPNDARDRARKAAQQLIQDSHTWTPETLADAVRSGRRDALAQAITWVESDLPEHQAFIEKLMGMLPPVEGTTRIGLTGVPGAGKSTFIERFGMNAIDQGWKVAVLAVDPTSLRSRGALLGDKTRMNLLSHHPQAFVRPSAAAATLGGVTRATNEAIQLCEAAGYNLILIETVGVGQSEVTVRSMVDFFVLLLISGAGDDVQGMKRGIVEMADLLVVHKAEEENINACRSTANSYRQALHLLPSSPSLSEVKVLLASSHTGEGHAEVWTELEELAAAWKQSGWWKGQRERQKKEAMQRHAQQLLLDSHMHHKSEMWSKLQEQVTTGQLTPMAAARTWVELPISSST